MFQTLTRTYLFAAETMPAAIPAPLRIQSPAPRAAGSVLWHVDHRMALSQVHLDRKPIADGSAEPIWIENLSQMAQLSPFG
jgi:hypothetical protein